MYLRQYGSRFFRTRKSSHSLCSSDGLNKTSTQLIEMKDRIKLFAPEKILARSIRPLVPDKITSTEGSEPEISKKIYKIRMSC